MAVWDTLLPTSRNRITQFQVGEAGITTLLYSSRHNFLISGGKRGYIFIIDMRKNLQVVNSFAAHETMVKSMTIDEGNNTLISGSGSGEIKVKSSNIDLGFEYIKCYRNPTMQIVYALGTIGQRAKRGRS